LNLPANGAGDAADATERAWDERAWDERSWDERACDDRYWEMCPTYSGRGAQLNGRTHLLSAVAAAPNR